MKRMVSVLCLCAMLLSSLPAWAQDAAAQRMEDIAALRAVLEEVQTKKQLDVYTLIAGDTFSSGVMNELDTKKRLDAVLVGSETGGAVNAFGELYTAALPHAPLVVSCSTKRFELRPDGAGNSLIPDIPAEQTLEDYMCGRDTVVEAVLAR